MQNYLNIYEKFCQFSKLILHFVREHRIYIQHLIRHRFTLRLRTYSKWSMDESFGLKFTLSYTFTPQGFFLKSLHVQTRSFLLMNLQFGPNILPFLKLISRSEKCFAHGGIFFLDHFSPSFLGQTYWFYVHTYSISST